MGTCRICGRSGVTISDVVGVCADCLRESPKEALEVALQAHGRWRSRAGLPPEPPKDAGGVRCESCVNRCSIPEGGRGYCGFVVNEGGRLRRSTGSWDVAPGIWYYDPHPTNCVSAPFCPGATCRGFPAYTERCGTETGRVNLAVFYGGCGLDCLFCQNWEHKQMALTLDRVISVGDLVSAGLDRRVTCVCYFGGDPAPFGAHSLAVARRLIEEAEMDGRKFRACWETNGTVNPRVAWAWMELALRSGGNVKIDFKAWTPSIYQALTGIDARDRVLENLRLLSKAVGERPDPPPLTVSVLLVPGYVDVTEVRQIAREVARLDPRIPVVLLGFKPDFLLRDLPTTSRYHARRSAEAAEEEGVEEVYVGNPWLLGSAY
ncbi:MAG: radical SAM protein [Candidatus Korarchaeota archaeon]|nr:radical SAM protein [Candidatus Korarchaeota archaeon]